MEEFLNYYKAVINEVATKAVEAFNSSYDLNINKDDVIRNVVNEINIQPPINEMSELSINNNCIAIKRNKENCSNKCVPGHVYCGIHIRFEGKLSLHEHVKLVASKYKYEVTANTLSLGSEWMMQNKSQINLNENIKWPFHIKTSSNTINSYILFFSEFPNYLGAGILIIHYISLDRKKSYYMATHYIEINKYCEEIQSYMYAKISLESINSLIGKPIFNKIKSFLGEYGIPYDINDINKRVNDVTENNPIIMYNNINKIIDIHSNNMYFLYDAYINSCINKN